MANLYDWSTTPADNDDADTGMTWAENQAPSTVNDSARQLMARVAEWRKDLAGSITTGGTGNAYTITINSTLGASYPDGLTVVFTADRANGGSATLSVNGGAAVSMRHKKSTALPANALVANQQYVARYILASNEFIVSGSRADIIELAPSLLSAQVFGLRVGDPIISLAPSPNPGFLRLTETTQAVLKADYPDLNSWASGLGYPWGSASTTFNLPPAAGYFLRFAGTSTSIDPDGPRTAGSTQTDLVKAHTHTGTTASDGAHTHTVPVAGAAAGNAFWGGGFSDIWSGGDNSRFGSAYTVNTGSGGAHTHTFTTDANTGVENRPKNVAFHIDILAKPALVANGLVGASGYTYKYSSTTTAADPGAGYFRFDAAMASATSLYISETDDLGVNIAASIATWDSSTSTIKGRLRFVKIGAPAITAEVDLVSTKTDNGAWVTFPVTVRGTPGAFSDGDQCHLHFVPKGDAGSGGGGGGGGDVVGPATAVNNRLAAFDGTTGKLLKDSGSTTASFEVAGAVTAHVALSHPHSQYIKTINAEAPDGAGNVALTSPDVPHTSAATGAVATTAFAKLDGFLDFVRDFGAVGNDSTANDTQWAAFVAAVAATGKPGYIPPGTYRVTTAAASVTPTGAFMIFGAGPASNIKRMDDLTSVLLLINSATGPIVRDMQFEYSNGTTTANGDHMALRFNGCTDPTDSNVTFKGGWYAAREDRDCIGARSIGPRVRGGIKNRAIYTSAVTLSRGTAIVAPDIDGGGVTSYGINTNGFGTGLVESFTVSGGRIFNVVSHGVGISDRSYAFTVQGVVVDIVTSQSGVGVLVQEANGQVPQDGTVTGNTIRQVWNGITNRSGLKVAITGNTITSAYLKGILNQGAQEGRVTGNNVTIALASGIAWVASTSYAAGAYVTNGGKLWQRNSAGTSRATFDATEQALHTEAVVGLDFSVDTITSSNAANLNCSSNRVRSNAGGTGIKSDAGSTTIEFDDNALVGFTTNYSVAGSSHTYGEDLRLAAGANQTVTAQVTFATTGIPVVIDSTNGAQPMQLKTSGTTRSYFGAAAGAPLYVQNTGGNNVFLLSDGASGAAANYPTFIAAAAGGPMEISAANGTDANVDVQLTPKGTGLVRFGTYTGGAPTATGYISIKAANGTTYKVLVGT